MPGQRTEKDPSPATEHTKRESPNFKAYVVVILGHQAPKHKARSPKPETLELACGGGGGGGGAVVVIARV